MEELDVYIKRFAKRRQISKEIRIGHYLFDHETRRLFHGDVFLKQITPLERNALVLFWENKNTPVSYDLLTKTLWGYSHSLDLDPSLHNLISKLRILLNKDERIWITTVKGKGYQLIDR